MSGGIPIGNDSMRTGVWHEHFAWRCHVVGDTSSLLLRCRSHYPEMAALLAAAFQSEETRYASEDGTSVSHDLVMFVGDTSSLLLRCRSQDRGWFTVQKSRRCRWLRINQRYRRRPQVDQ